MRIALISPYAWAVPGGVNDHVANLAVQLEERGHEPWVISPDAPFGRRGTQVPYPDRFIPAGWAVPFRTNGSRAYLNVYPHAPLQLRRKLREGRFDIFHIHEPAVPPTAFLSVFLADAPVVATFHAAGVRPTGYEMFGSIVERLMDNIATRIAVSTAARDYVAQCFPGDYRIVPNGVSTEAYVGARDGAHVPGRIVFIGRAEPRKGLHVLLQSFQLLREKRPEASLHIVGTGPDELLRAARQVWPGARGPVPGVTPLGRVSHEEKVSELRSAELAVVPSLEGESFGIVLIECLAAGVPVVASDLPGYNSVLEDGRLGSLVPPGDVAELTGALHELLGDEERRREMSALGIREVERYCWSRVSDEVLALYEETLETAPLPVFPNSELLAAAGQSLKPSASRQQERVRTS